jgi:hypothetical protein
MNVIYAFHAITVTALIAKLLSLVSFSWFWFAIPFTFYAFIAVSLFVANRRINNGGSFFKSKE